MTSPEWANNETPAPGWKETGTKHRSAPMPRIAYVEKTFKGPTLAVIQNANKIIDEYMAAGYKLTLRQLYYQFVARGLIENTQRAYKRLGKTVSDARLAGLIDWDAIEDRTRNLLSVPTWESPASIVGACADQFRIDKWERQEFQPEVWIEKDALIGVIERPCSRLQVPWFSCRGYTSQSELWAAGQRLAAYGRTPVVIHLGDHDPSGIDMTRDIIERVSLFAEMPVKVERIALNRDQVDEYKPPPNPAKIEDPRASDYIALHGTTSWELDALDPDRLDVLIEYTIKRYLDDRLWDDAVEEERIGRERLSVVAKELASE